ncbi:MAG: glutamate-5-semialdehyde dehydrogenase [Bacteriovoracaceae bacterium]|jgi:glutamate-5-semialdehyde dehydrogenase|nr:glutamate-5-semialdehyde dehydrogenase [Halobacteriovoraceae bacterium]MDP7321143.1 glutamate-5-semialdehyde dehydrogenase [Bacteriovoracaceae bacterium]
MKKLAKNAKKASKELLRLDSKMKNQIFDELIHHLEKRKKDVLEENKKDLENAFNNDLNSAMVDRLKLTDERFDQMVAGVEAIKNQPDMVGEFYGEFTNDLGLKIKRQRVPLGVILMIFESRPNVVIDCAALALKSSNSIILKGGKEAKHSNEILGEIIQDSLQKFISPEAVQVLASDSREQVEELLSLKDDIDVVIPRGGHGLINYVYETAKMPVIAHYQGLCHMYLDKEADVDQAINLAINAKTQRTGVCNAIETLIIHEDILPKIAQKLVAKFDSKGTQLKVDKGFQGAITQELENATDEDWQTEYLDNVLSVKTVKNLDEAIEHIDQYGSHHSECIVSTNEKTCAEFLKRVDASCVMINASTRFNDGGQLGLGAELGISTTKLHAYGPMGVEQMTTSRYVVLGDGQIRE